MWLEPYPPRSRGQTERAFLDYPLGGKTSLQQHANEVGRLVTLRYAELDNQQQRNLAVEAFTNSLGNPSSNVTYWLSTPQVYHLLLGHSNEFLNINAPTMCNVRQLEEEGTE